MRPARLRGDMGEQSNIKHKVEAKNPALWKNGHPAGPGEPMVRPATFYIPFRWGGKGLCGRYGLSDTYLTYASEDQAETRASEERIREA